MKVVGDPSPGSPLIPEILYSFFQMEFACVTAGILVGGLAERGRVLPAMIFTFLWVTVVYCPIAYWAWGVNGWAFKWGVLDFAGEAIVLTTCALMDLICTVCRRRACRNSKRS
jgi:ammonium transporter, Amt family